MGVRTVAVLVSEGLLMAGDTSLTTRMLVHLKAWLGSQYAAFPWPFLQRELSAVALAASAQTLAFGNGSGGVTEQVQRIDDPMKIYTSNYSSQGEVRIRTLWGSGTLGGDNVTVNPTLNRGMPDLCRVKADPTLGGKWNLVFNRVADRAYLLYIKYGILPAEPGSSDIPLYPNDRTMMKVVEVEALRYKKSWEEYKMGFEELAAMTIADRAKYGIVDGTNDSIGLDSQTFR